MSPADPPPRTLRKVKTGCITCRIRKVKCDEGKPDCQRCKATGRKCDGYSSVFRNTGTPTTTTPTTTVVVAASITVQQTIQQTSSAAAPAVGTPAIHAIAPEQITNLSQKLTSKPTTGCSIEYEAEARAMLYASISEVTIRHAVNSLLVLRRSFDLYGDLCDFDIRDTADFRIGLQHYNAAVASLAVKLSERNRSSVESALHCCQLFISIEVMQRNYTSAMRHFINGVKIMHDCSVRPALDANGNLKLRRYNGLPLVDIFVIKLCTFPCPSLPRPRGTAPQSPQSLAQARQSILGLLMRDFRAQRDYITLSTINLLNRISLVESEDEALAIFNDKLSLLEVLQKWMNDMSRVLQRDDASDIPEASTRFNALFHSIMRLIILSSLNYSDSMAHDFKAEFEEMMSAAEALTAFLNPDIGLQ